MRLSGAPGKPGQVLPVVNPSILSLKVFPDMIVSPLPRKVTFTDTLFDISRHLTLVPYIYDLPASTVFYELFRGVYLAV